MHIWMRDEARDTERRAPLVPDDAATLIAAGTQVSVERSEKRIFSDDAYTAAGCSLVDAGSWTDAPTGALVLGVKELPAQPDTLHGHFAHFAHLYKDQRGWRDEIARFGRGGATLYDLEYLTDTRGVRVAAFGYWAGWLGAAIGLSGWLSAQRGAALAGVAAQETREGFLVPIRAMLAQGDAPRALVVGALGRSGQGACDLFTACGIEPTRWDQAETRDLDRPALLAHDLLVSCVLLRGPGLLLATKEALSDAGARLSMISDVACDPLSDFNPLPVYDVPTGWDTPFIEVAQRESATVHLTAIDNLPSLLPKEASEDFSRSLTPVLGAFSEGTPWRNAERDFKAALQRAGL